MWLAKLASLGRVIRALPYSSAAAPDADIEAPQVLRDLVAAKSVNDPQTLLGPSGQIAFVWQTPLAISATQIRHLLATQRCVRYLVPDTVFQYIYTHQLYQE